MPVQIRRRGVARIDESWRAQRFLCLVLVLMSFSFRLLDAGEVLAQSASSPSNSPANLDLSSTHPSLQAPNSAPVTIMAGGTVRNGSVTGGSAQTIIPGQLLTPAQYLAATGAMKGGQTLLLNAPGQATGGYANYASSGMQQLSSVLVPQNVSLNAIGFNAANPLNVSGGINILGALHALQTTQNVSSVLKTGDLNIAAGGLLSGMLPYGVNLGAGIFASNGLQIIASNNVSNFGTITTPGTLSITAGSNINNQSAANSAALMSSQNINLVTGSGLIFNSGLIQALNSININTMDSLTALNVNSTAGTFEAINGTIDLRDVLFKGTANTDLIGGNWLSQELNLNAGQGTVNVNAGVITGTINANAEAAHVLASTPKLTLGNMKIDGDPTYVNAGGDIQIVGTVSENEDLAIIASGNITASGDAQIINHGHNVWMIAGAQVDIVSGSCNGCGNSGTPLDLPPGTASPIVDGFVQVSATGGAGGNIDMQTGNTLPSGQTVIDTSSIIPTTPGGAVTLVAIANGATGGQVLFPTTAGVTSINSSGKTSGANGNVTIFAGSNSGEGVEIGAVSANGGTGFSSKVAINTAQAEFGGGAGACASCMSFDKVGVATGGIVFSVPTNSSITVNGPLNVSNGYQIKSDNGSISLIMDSFNVPGSIDAGTGDISIRPATPGRTIFLMGSGSGLNVSSQQLSEMTAGSITFGSKSSTGGIILKDDIDVSGKCNLQLLQGTGGGFDADGNSIIVGSKTLTIDVGGDANLGPIVTSGTILQITGANVIVNSPIGSPGDITTITTLVTSVLAPGDPPVPIPASGAISGTGLITAQHLTLNSAGAMGMSRV